MLFGMGYSAPGAWSLRCGALGALWLLPATALAQAPGPASAVAPPAAEPVAAAPSAKPAPSAPPPAAAAPDLPRDESEEFLRRASPWVDFSLTSFYLDERVGNFLNLGVQAGVYAFGRLRLSLRLVTPLEQVDDGGVTRDYPNLGQSSSQEIASRSLSLLYGASVGVVVTNSKSFVFGPSLTLLRTDVEDYGSSLGLGMPFEWTTKNNLRVGFEPMLGHAFGGSVREQCLSGTKSCGLSRRERPGGTAVLFQFSMGWALGRL